MKKLSNMLPLYLKERLFHPKRKAGPVTPVRRIIARLVMCLPLLNYQYDCAVNARFQEALKILKDTAENSGNDENSSTFGHYDKPTKNEIKKILEEKMTKITEYINDQHDPDKWKEICSEFSIG